MLNREYQLSLYEKAVPDELALEDKIEKSIEMGFDSCEICIDMNGERQKRLDWSEHQLIKLNKFVKSKKIQLPTMTLTALRGCTLGSLEEEKMEKAFTLIKKAFRFAQIMAVDTILINAYDVFDGQSTEKTRRRFDGALAEAVRIAEQYGVVIGLENSETSFGDSLQKVSRWVEEIDSNNLKIYYDPANAYNTFEGDLSKVKADFIYGNGQIAAAHVKDSVSGDYRMTPYGKGQVDFSQVIPMMLDAGITQFTAELFLLDHKNWESYAKWVNQFLRDFF